MESENAYRRAIEIIRDDWYTKHNRHNGALKWFAEQLGVSKQTLDNWRKRHGFPPKYLPKICEITKLSEKELFKSQPKIIPKSGTQIRKAYDLFQSNKGVPIKWKYRTNNPAVIVRLINQYEQDIKHLGQGSYVLEGETVGGKYVSYSK